MNKNIISVLFYVKLGLSRITLDEKVTQGNAIISCMSSNPNFPTIANPTLPEFQTCVAYLVDSVAAYRSNDGRNQKAEMLACEIAYNMMASQLGLYVQRIADATPANSKQIILSAGMNVRRSRLPNPLPEAVTLLTIKTLMPGTIKLKITGGKYKKVCQVFMSTVEAPDAWQQIGLCQKRSYVVANLIRGKSYNFKVVPNGTAGAGPESNVISQYAA